MKILKTIGTFFSALGALVYIAAHLIFFGVVAILGGAILLGVSYAVIATVIDMI